MDIRGSKRLKSPEKKKMANNSNFEFGCNEFRDDKSIEKV